MAIPEACGVWIEQRVQEELDAKGECSKDAVVLILKEFSETYVAPVVDRIEKTTGMKPYYSSAIISNCVTPFFVEKSMPSNGYIYYFKSGPLVKIGFATNVNNRLKTIQNMSALSVSCIGSHVGTITEEREIHKKFKRLRDHGEWFVLNRDICEYIKERNI